MKKITLSLLFGFMSLIGFSQIGLVENFDAGFTLPTGWTSDAEDYAVAFVENCDGRSVRANLDDTNLDAHLTSPNLVGQSNGTDLTIAFDYKIVDWAGAIEATAPGWGEILIQYSVNDGGAWTTIETINDVNHSTSNTCFNWSTSVPAADVPIGSDFKLRINTNWANGTFYVYLDNISATQVVDDPPSCVNLITPLDGSNGVTVNTDLEWSVATGITSGYTVSVGTTPGGVDIVDNENVGLSTTYDLPVLEYSTTYYVNIIPFNASGEAVGCTEFTFMTGADPNAPVDCAAGTPINTVYCYDSNETITWNFQSSDGAPLNIFFNAGQFEACCDDVIVYDGIDNTGTVLFSDGLEDMAGVSVIADSGFMFVEIVSDGSVSCASNNFTPLDFDVTCVDESAVPNCNAALTTPVNGATDVDVATVISWSPASVVVTGYFLSIGTTPGGTDILDNMDVGNVLTYTPGSLLDYETTFYVSITPYNDNGLAVNCSENTFTTELNPYQCEAVDQCVFTFVIEDSFGDGWNGNTMTVSQNGLEIEILELTGGAGPEEIQIPLCDGIPVELFWNEGGGFAGEVMITVLNAFNDEVFVMPNGNGALQGSQIFTDIVNCTPPSCPRPTDITLVEVNMTTVEIGWTETGTSNTWEVIVQPLGDGYPDGTEPEIIQTTDNPYTYENLNPATQYEIYVRAICGTDDLSDWEGPLPFDTTICDAVDQCLYTFVLEDSFGDGWNGNTMTVSQNNIELQVLELPGGAGPVEVQVALCDGVPFELFWNEGGAFAGEVMVSVFNAFDDELFNMPNNSGALQGTQLFSDIVNCTPPTCPRPDDITIVTLNPTSVEIGWTETGVATTWEVIVQAQGTGYPDGTEPEIIQTTDNPYTYEGLTSGVDYEIYVRAICATDDLSDWEGPLDFTTPQSVDCASGELLNTTYCYTDDDTTEFIYASSDGSQLVVFFNAGYLEGCCDELIVTDSDGTELYNDNNGGDLTGLIFISSGNTITIAVSSDGSVNCGSTGNAQWDFDVACFDALAVPNCNAEMTTPTDGAIDVDINTDITWSAASIFVTGYTISIGTTPGGTDIADNIDVGDVLTYDPGVLTNATFYYVTIVPYNDNGPAIDCEEQSFKTICIPQEVSFNAIGDCDTDPNNPDFVLEVNITDLSGSASILVSDDQGSPVQTATEAGVITMGPYAANTVVTITTIKSDDDTCDVVSTPITFICPPPPNPCSIIYAGEDATVDCLDTSTDLAASYHLFGQDTNTYIINGLDTCPLPSTVGGTPTSLDIDDTWSDVLDIGFEFCFFGEVYDQILVGSNGVLSFELENANTGNGWAMGAGDTLPNNTNATLGEANIFGVGHDIDPSVTGDINYLVIGSAPYRQFVVNYTDVAHFSGACNDLLSSSQIILYESSNNIDVNVFDKPICTTWNSGRAVIGVQNIPGTVAFVPPSRNVGAWEATDESWRFAPSEGTPNYTFEWFDGATSLGNTENITVSPTETTTYTASVTYELCTGGTATITDEVVIEVIDDTVDTSFTMATTCDGGIATIDGETGGTFSFNPEPTDGAMIDPVSGEVTGATSLTTYTIQYSVTSTCTTSSTQDLTTLMLEDATFTVTATCDGGTATIEGDTGGMFAFNPMPTDGAMIDAATGEVTEGTSGAMYIIEYTTPGTCPVTSMQTLTVLPSADTSFTMMPTCDGGIATIEGDTGGVFTFNPVPTDGAVIDAATGEVTGGMPDAMYITEYTITGACPSVSTQTLTVYSLEDATFTITATCDGGTAEIEGDVGGTFTFNPMPTDDAVIDAATGEITGGTAEEIYTVEYTTSGPCPEMTTQTVTVLPSENASFTIMATCDGGIATITGDTGGMFTFNPMPTDGAVIDPITGQVTGTPGETYTVEYTTSGSCPDTIAQTFTVLPAENASFTMTASCTGGTALITGDTGGVFAIIPAPTDGAVIDSITGEVTNGSLGETYIVEYTTSGPCSNSTFQTLTLLTDVFDFIVEGDCNGAIYELTVTPINNGYDANNATYILYDDMGYELQTNPVGDNVFVIDASIFTPPMSGSTYNYVVEVISDVGCVQTSQVFIESINCIIPQGISPNNDGKNDNFDLTGYEVSRLEIFNRHGVKVYSKTNYTNDWYGQSDGGEELPVGTYFYVMEYQGNKTRTSWIYLNREN